MSRPILALLLLLFVACCQAAEEPKVIAVSEWSKPVESHDRFLRARWLLLEGRSRAYAGPGTEVLLYVELENANGAWGPPLRVFFDPANGLQFDVVDADGKSVPPSPVGGSGGDVGAGWITIPYDSTVRLRANPGGWGKPADAALALPLRPLQGRYWLFDKPPAGDLSLTGKLVISPPTDDSFEHRDDWRGTLEFPPTKLVPKKP
jgi:hypothetical protein